MGRPVATRIMGIVNDVASSLAAVAADVITVAVAAGVKETLSKL